MQTVRWPKPRSPKQMRTYNGDLDYDHSPRRDEHYVCIESNERMENLRHRLNYSHDTVLFSRPFRRTIFLVFLIFSAGLLPANGLSTEKKNNRCQLFFLNVFKKSLLRCWTT